MSSNIDKFDFWQGYFLLLAELGILAMSNYLGYWALFVFTIINFFIFWYIIWREKQNEL